MALQLRLWPTCWQPPVLCVHTDLPALRRKGRTFALGVWQYVVFMELQNGFKKSDAPDLWTKQKIVPRSWAFKKGPHSWRRFQVSQMEQTLEAKSCQGTQIWEVSPKSIKLNWSHLWLKTAHRFLRQSPGHRCCHLWRCHEAEPGVVQQSESTGFFWVF